MHDSYVTTMLFKSGEQWQPERRQNIFITLPQGWVLAHKHQCTMAITMVLTKFLWGFPVSYAAKNSQIGCSSNDRLWEDKRAQNSTIKVSLCTIIKHLSQCIIRMVTGWPGWMFVKVNQNQSLHYPMVNEIKNHCKPFLWAVRFN